MKLKIYSIIHNRLYQSAKTHDLSIVEKKVLVKMNKIDMIVNLWHTPDEEIAHMIPSSYIHRYIPDGKGNPEIYEELEKLADILAPQIKKGQVALVHCYGGRNRSGLFNAMLVMRIMGCDGKTALGYIQEMRPNSLVNETFAEYLRKR